MPCSAARQRLGRGCPRRRRAPTRRRAPRGARRRRRSRRSAAGRRRTARRPRARRRSCRRPRRAAAGRRPPGSPGRRRRGPARPSLPPLVATTRVRAERAGGLVAGERLLGVARVATRTARWCRASSTAAGRRRAPRGSAARRVSPSAARASAPPMAEPPMPATTRPSGLSHGSSCADSTFHSASRRCSGIASTSVELVGGVDRRDRLAVERSRRALLMRRSPRRASHRSRTDRAVGELGAGEDLDARGEHVAGADGDALAEDRAAVDRARRRPCARRRRRCSRAARSPRRSSRRRAPPRARRARRRRPSRRRPARPGCRRARPRRSCSPSSTTAGGTMRPSATTSSARRGSRPRRSPRRCDVALEDVERALQVALGRPDVHPVRLRRGEAVEAVADERAARPRARSRRCGRAGSGRARERSST